MVERARRKMTKTSPPTLATVLGVMTASTVKQVQESIVEFISYCAAPQIYLSPLAIYMYTCEVHICISLPNAAIINDTLLALVENCEAGSMCYMATTYQMFTHAEAESYCESTHMTTFYDDDAAHHVG